MDERDGDVRGGGDQGVETVGAKIGDDLADDRVRTAG